MSTATALRQPTSAFSPHPSVSSVSSVSSVVKPSSSHTPHTAHPIPLREHAFTLHCQGLRSPAIAAELGVSERTIRAWVAAALDDLKDDLQLTRRQQLLLAVERQHQLTAVAWQQFEREAAARDALLDAAPDTLLNAATAATAASNPSDSAGVSTRPLHLHLPASTPAPRYLSLILQANKETNRLLGLHTLAKLHLLTSDIPDIPEIDPAPLADSTTPAESATGTSTLSADGCEIPAESATDSESAAADFAAARHPGVVLTASRLAAKTATVPAAPASSPAFRPSASAPAFQDRDSHNPAESATASADPQHAAKTATDPATLAADCVGASVGCSDPKIPAKTATASGSPRPVGEGLGVRSPAKVPLSGTRRVMVKLFQDA